MPPFVRNSSSPFARYFPTAAEAPIPNPNRFALARMGIIAEELSARAGAELDPILNQLIAEATCKNYAWTMPSRPPRPHPSRLQDPVQSHRGPSSIDIVWSLEVGG